MFNFLFTMYYYFVWMISLVGVLVSVLFLTLLERKIISYVGMRKGPNKVSFIGIGQAVGDAIKLFVKEISRPTISKIFIYWFSPIMFFFIFLISWLFVYFFNSVIMFYLGFIGFLCVSSLGVYVLLGSGWSSNSKYSLIGCLRGAAQNMSYEVVFVFMLLMPFSFISSFNISWYLYDGVSVVFIGWFYMFLIWLVVCFSETNRAPFDFSEGESELVSGFNVEYGALQFAFLYLGEYGSMLLLSFMSGIFLVGLYPFKNLVCIVFLVFFIWVRSSLPRFRYDLLMEVSWVLFLPIMMMSLLLMPVFSV